MKLISMIEFVLEQSIKRSVDNWPIETEDYFNRCEAYANFLKQPLNLGMFVPCDLEGNIIEQPCDIINTDGCRDCACKEYKKSQERVLFKGFELDFKSDYTTIVWNKEIDVEVKFRNQDSQKTTIEKQFINHYTKGPLELTESAIKQFL